VIEINLMPVDAAPLGVRRLIDNRDGTHTVPLTQGLFAIVDSADADVVAARSWYAVACDGNGVFYAARNEWSDSSQHRVLMHRQIMRAGRGLVVDHVDRDGLNNRRSNLRIATQAQNSRNRRRHRNNTSGFKGVSFHRREKKWYAHIHHQGKKLFLGYFVSAEAAHAAYCDAAARLHGEFARFE